MTKDLSALWDFSNPDGSEERFRSALATASGNDALILQTQLARTYGLRRDFSTAQQILAGIEPQIHRASHEAKVRYYLELGRTYSSATHPAESQTAEARELARAAFLRAAELAQEGQFDSLAVDALHMLAFVDTTPEAQLAWNRRALALVQFSSEPDARQWEGPLYNNTGCALYLLRRYEDALAEFKLALAAHTRGGNPQKVRVAHWMVAWTLRALGQLHEAIEIQLSLEEAYGKAGEPDRYVFEELELLYEALDEREKAEYYATRRKAIS